MTEPNRGTMEDFDALHGLLTQVMVRELQRYLQNNEAPPAALLAQARQLLQDNDINVPAKSRRIDELAATMPDFNDDLPKFTPEE